MLYTEVVPAPWNLVGRGYILLYRLDREFLSSHHILGKEELKDFAGGFGAVMLVEYKDSNVGPYQELLFIPGKFRVGDDKWHRITRIYVSTDISVVNGRKNWGIPKELAKFSFLETEKGQETIEAFKGQDKFFQTTLSTFGPSFPIHTALMPLPLMQKHQDRLLQTTFRGSGFGRLTKVLDIWADEAHFPNLSAKKPLLAIQVTDFKIVFPKATEYPTLE